MKVVITGGSGMIGSAFTRVSTNHELVLINRSHADLLVRGQFTKVLKKESPDAVIHLAARVGGVKSNTKFVSDFYSQNVRINCNVLDECHAAGIERVVSLLSTCVYPNEATYPLTENQMHSGPPHFSNFGYAHAKRMLDVHSRSLRQQHGRNYICAIPNNVYGESDFYDLENSHVIPAIIRKMHEARMSNGPVELWGSGSPLREFTYSTDIAKILLFLLERYNGDTPINIGNNQEASIRFVAEAIASLSEFKNKIIWDSSKPEGQYRKPSCNRLLLDLGWNKEDYTTLDQGLQKTIAWFLTKYPDVRGIS
jgi:GDP-L-fucose synthase